MAFFRSRRHARRDFLKSNSRLLDKTNRITLEVKVRKDPCAAEFYAEGHFRGNGAVAPKGAFVVLRPLIANHTYARKKK